MISCTSEYSPNFYSIVSQPILFGKVSARKKEQIIAGCAAHAPEAPDVVPLLRETQVCLPGLGTEGSDSPPASPEALYFAEKSAILKLSEGIL